MFNSDNKHFEAYLKNFMPMAPTALPRNTYRRHRSIRVLALWGSIAASVTILIIGIVVWHTRTLFRHDPRIIEPVSVNSKPPLAPLTIDPANRWLEAAPSVDAALDDLAFRAKNAPISTNKKSALAVLREENMHL